MKARAGAFDLAGAGATVGTEAEAAANVWPHFKQNCESSGISLPHFGQNMGAEHTSLFVDELTVAQTTYGHDSTT